MSGAAFRSLSCAVAAAGFLVLCVAGGFCQGDLLKLLLVLSLMNSALNPVSVWCDFTKHAFSFWVEKLG